MGVAQKFMSIFFPFLIGCFEVKPVEMRIRKKWDWPSEQGSALAVLATAFLLGGTAGCLLAVLSNESGIEELCAYLTDYLILCQEDSPPRTLWPILWGQLKYLLATLILSLTAMGLAGLPVLFGVRGFFLSFSVACFCRVFGGKGLVPAFVLFGLPALLWAPALFIVGTFSFLSAWQLLRRFLGEGREGSPLGRGFWYRAAFCTGMVIAAGLLEYWVVPVLLRGLARVIL